MRKYLLLAVFASIGIAAKAQIIGSETKDVVITRQEEPQKIKKPRRFRWNVRAGYSIDLFTGYSEWLGSTSGLDIGFGIVWPIGEGGLFFGAEVTGTSRRASVKNRKQTINAWGFSASPYIGIKLPVGKSASIAPYLGPYGSCAWGSGYGERFYPDDSFVAMQIDPEIPDVGINVGVSFFFNKNFYMDVRCKKGFITSDWIEDYRSYSNNTWNTITHKVSPLKIIIGLGYQYPLAELN